MKKRLFLIIAVIMIAITSCAMLVACKDDNGGEDSNTKTNIAESPTAFIEQWKALESNKYFKDYTDVVLGASGNIVINDAGNFKIYFEVPEKDKLNVYTLRSGAWTRESYDNFEDIYYKYKYQLSGLTELKNVSPFVNTAAEYAKMLGLDQFEKNCTKADNVYTGNAGTVFEKVKITITEKDLTAVVPSNFDLEDYDPNEEDVEMLEFKFGIGYNAITIPEEAKNAPDVTNRRVIEKAILKYLNSDNIYVKVMDNNYYFYNNIIKIENQDITAYIEMQDNEYVLYKCEYVVYPSEDVIWTAESLDKETLAEKVRDIFGSGLNPHNFDNIEELFEELSRNELTDRNGIDLYYELVADGVYKSKNNDYEKIEIKETKVVYYNNDEIYSELGNCDAFTIPQEAKDALAQ